MADMTNALTSLLEESLADPGCGWSLGTFGAIAEFLRDADEPARFDRSRGLAVATPRGALRVEPQPGLRAIAYETPSTNSSAGWNQAIALCLPEEGCGMSGRRLLTELGPDEGAVRAEDRTAILFDLGLGAAQVDLCVRSADPAVIERLRAACGRPLLEPGNELMQAMPALSPHRVFLCRFGRIEVFQPIPAPTETSPEGPHTHVLPKLLRQARTHAATTPLPAGWSPCMHLYPPHPLKDAGGRAKPFDRPAHAAFQDLLQSFGDPEAVALKRQVALAVHEGLSPEAFPLPAARSARAIVRVALRQLAQLTDPPPRLGSWRRFYDGSQAGP